MKKALILLDDTSRVIEISDSIFNLFTDVDEIASQKMSVLKERFGEKPSEHIMNSLHIFDCLEDTDEEREDDEILDGYFLNIASKDFGLDVDETIVEYYNLSEEDISNGIDMVVGLVVV